MTEFVSGFDSYNLCLTGDIGRTIATPSGGLNEHIPIVIGCDTHMKALFVDLYNGTINGDVSCSVTAACGASANHSGPSILVLNDMGGSVMNVSDIPSTLRAQMKHHEPIVCFEPGILSRDCSAGNRAYINICSTLRAQMGDNQPAICYEEVNEQSEVPESMGLPKQENLHDRRVISDTSCL